MPKIQAVQTNFTSGEISPLLESRIDLDFYSNGAREIKNFVVMPTGGVRRRGGMQYVDNTKNYTSTQNVRLIPFIYSKYESFILEFGHQYARVILNEALVYIGRGRERIVNGTFDYDISGWTNRSTGTGTISYDSGNKRLNVSGGTGGVGIAEQEIRNAKKDKVYTLMLDIWTNNITVRIGSVSGGQQYVSDTSLAPGYRTVSFTPTTTNFFVQFRNSANNTSSIDNISITENLELNTNPTMTFNITGYTNLSTGTGTISPSSGAMVINGGSDGVGWAQTSFSAIIDVEYYIEVEVNTNPCFIRIGTTSGSTNILSDTLLDLGVNKLTFFSPHTGNIFIGLRNPNNNQSIVDNFFIRAYTVLELDTPYSHTDLSKIKYIQNHDTMFLFHPDYSVNRILCEGAENWTFYDHELEPMFIDGPYFDEETTTKITPSATTGTVTLTATAPLWNVNHVGSLWRIKHGTTWGYVVIRGFTSPTSVTAEVKKTLGGTGQSAAYREGIWSKYRGFPCCGTFHEGRLIAGGASHSAQTICGSKCADESGTNYFMDMTPGTLDNDAFVYTIGSDTADPIIWLKSMGDLIIGTMSGKYIAKGGADNPISPTNIDIKNRSSVGSADIDPIRIGNSLIHVQQAGKKLIEFTYNWTSDAWMDDDITIRAEHLFEPGIKTISYQQEPYGIIWVLLNNGKLCAMTYNKTQKVYGCFSLDVSGFIESLAVIFSTIHSQDQFYVVVNRGTTPSPKKYIECLNPDLNTDSSLVYEGSPVNTVYGMDHLIGRTVSIVGDGAVYPPAVVGSGGEVVLEGPPASKIEIGLNYESKLVSLRPEVSGGEAGTSQGLPKHWSTVWVRLYRTIGCTIGEEFIPFRTSDDETGSGISPFTGDKRVSKLGWDNDGIITVRQTQPLPITVLSIFGTLDIGL